jgi:hypothetical protein
MISSADPGSRALLELMRRFCCGPSQEQVRRATCRVQRDMTRAQRSARNRTAVQMRTFLLNRCVLAAAEAAGARGASW